MTGPRVPSSSLPHFNMKNYYAVRAGYETGIFNDLEDAKDQIRGFPNAQWKGFYSYEEAEEYLQFKDNSLRHRNNNNLWVHDVYTDGACSRNGQPDACGGVGVFFGHNHHHNISERLRGQIQTNQRAELMAVLRAVQVIGQYHRHSDDLFVIHSDSAYAINCLTVWCNDWIDNGWINSKGLPVANQDLIKSILITVQHSDLSGRISFAKVLGHSGDVSNDEADRLAREGTF